MTVLSSKDKMRLRVSSARVERWNRDKLKPVDNSKRRCHLLGGGVGVHSEHKAAEVIQPDKLEQIERLTDGHKMRLSAGKLTLIRRGDNFSDYHGEGYSEAPRDPVWKDGQVKTATARPDSPFKRAGKAVASVVIVRKGKPE